jgi:hypothetical protein
MKGDLRGWGTLIRPRDLLVWIQYHRNLIRYPHLSSARPRVREWNILMTTDSVCDMFNMISDFGYSDFFSLGRGECGVEATRQPMV